MIKTTYSIRTDQIIDEDYKSHRVYGINAFQNNKIRKSIPDVFFEKAEAENFVNLCNSLELDIIHLDDVTEDVLP